MSHSVPRPAARAASASARVPVPASILVPASALAVLLITLASAVPADAAEPLAGRRAVFVTGGVWSLEDGGASVAVDPADAAVDIDAVDFAGGIGYVQWLSESWAVGLSLRTLSQGRVSASALAGVSTTAVQATSVLLEVRRYLPDSARGGSFRPFLSAGLGPVVGHQAGVTIDREVAVGARDETVPGGYLGGGVDVVLGRRFMLELTAGYVLMARFDEPVGGRSDFDGMQTGLGICYVWGSPK